MADSHSPRSLPPSGSWSGYYFYGNSGAKHRMRLHLNFTADGKISGNGSDDIAPFIIRGIFTGALNQASWTKTYVGMHSVEYHGLYDGRSICGDWSLTPRSGGFWIWPDTIAGEQALHMEL